MRLDHWSFWAVFVAFPLLTGALAKRKRGSFLAWNGIQLRSILSAIPIAMALGKSTLAFHATPLTPLVVLAFRGHLPERDLHETAGTE